jgi:hypothetical protein
VCGSSAASSTLGTRGKNGVEGFNGRPGSGRSRPAAVSQAPSVGTRGIAAIPIADGQLGREAELRCNPVHWATNRCKRQARSQSAAYGVCRDAQSASGADARAIDGKPLRAAQVKAGEKPYLIARVGLNKAVLLEAAGSCVKFGSGGPLWDLFPVPEPANQAWLNTRNMLSDASARGSG